MKDKKDINMPLITPGKNNYDTLYLIHKVIVASKMLAQENENFNLFGCPTLMHVIRSPNQRVCYVSKKVGASCSRNYELFTYLSANDDMTKMIILGSHYLKP